MKKKYIVDNYMLYSMFRVFRSYASYIKLFARPPVMPPKFKTPWLFKNQYVVVT